MRILAVMTMVRNVLSCAFCLLSLFYSFLYFLLLLLLFLLFLFLFLLSSSSSFPSLPSISIEKSCQHRRERTAGRSAGGMPGVTAGMLRNKTGRISPNFTLWQSAGNPPTSIPQFLLLEAPMCRNSARLWSGDWLGRQDSTGPVSSCWLCHPISLVGPLPFPLAQYPRSHTLLWRQSASPIVPPVPTNTQLLAPRRPSIP